MTRPDLSILLLTHNHENYIRQSLDGILAQETGYRYEIILAEDCSTDGTAAIAREYQSRYPDKIRLFSNRRNRGGKKTFISGYHRLRGKYVCNLDGDDYWTDPRKLQLQLDFLERHPEYVGCTHNTRFQYENGEAGPDLVLPPGTKGSLDLSDLANTTYLHTSSLIFRNLFDGKLPKSQRHPLSGDWFLTMLYACHGPIHFIDRVMSVYRIHSHGEWSGLPPLERQIKNIDGLVVYERLLGESHKSHFTRIGSEARAMAERLRGHGRRLLYFKYHWLANSRNDSFPFPAIKRLCYGVGYRLLCWVV